jgi:hypothetical protein
MISFSTKSSGWPTKSDLDDLAEEHVKEVMGAIFRTAVKLSPVLTGAFRASWRVSFNEPREDVTKGYVPEAPIRGAYFRWPKGFKLGYTVIISNNQPYAELLENGSSSQAPFGVLGLAVASVTLR